MKANFWTFVIAVIFVLTIIFWIIPAILKWQQNEHDHEKKVVEKIAALKNDNESTSVTNEKSFKSKMLSFFRKTLAEVLPAIAGKIVVGS